MLKNKFNPFLQTTPTNNVAPLIDADSVRHTSRFRKDSEENLRNFNEDDLLNLENEIIEPECKISHDPKDAYGWVYIQ